MIFFGIQPSTAVQIALDEYAVGIGFADAGLAVPKSALREARLHLIQAVALPQQQCCEEKSS